MQPLTYRLDYPSFNDKQFETLENFLNKELAENRDNPVAFCLSMRQAMMHRRISQNLYHILFQLFKQPGIIFNISQEFAYKLILSFDQHELKNLFESPFDLLIPLFNFFDSSYKRNIISFAIGYVMNWQDFFLHIFQSLGCERKSNDFFHLPSVKFCDDLTSSLSFDNKRSWIKYCCSQLSENWTFFVLTLQDEDQLEAIDDLFNHLMMDLPNKFISILNTLTQKEELNNLSQKLVKKVVDQIFLMNMFETIAGQFDKLNSVAQIEVLNLLIFSRRKKIFENYADEPSLLASWLLGLFKYKTTFNSRKQIVKDIFNELEKDLLLPFLVNLNKHYSAVGLYLLLELSAEDFDNFCLEIPVKERTEFLHHIVLDSNSAKTFQALSQSKRQMLYTVMNFDMENKGVLVESPFTLENCFQVINKTDKQTETFNLYTPFIQRISPILIGISWMRPNQRKILFDLVPYLNEEQVKFLVCNFSDRQFTDFINQTECLLNSGQLIAVLEGIPENQLNNYLKNKATTLEKNYLLFNEKRKSLQSKIENFQLPVFSTNLQPLQQQYQDLMTLIRQVDSLPYRILEKIIDHPTIYHFNLIVENVYLFKNLLQKFRNEKNLFFGSHALLRTQLENLEKNIMDQAAAEIDILDILHPSFWNLVNEHNLPYLGISIHGSLGIKNAGELTQLGIRSNDDLAYLGISQILKNHIEKLFFEIEKFKTVKKIKKDPLSSCAQINHETALNLKNLWKKFMAIENSEEDLQTIGKEITDYLNIQHFDFSASKEDYLSFVHSLSQLLSLSADEKILIEKEISLVNDIREDEQIDKKIFSQSFKKLLIILRNQHPLFCLKRYLNMNTDLKKTWQFFHSKGVFSVSDLFHQKYIQNNSELFMLESISNLKIE